MENLLEIQAAIELQEAASISSSNLREVRNIGPTNMGGRITELSMDPMNPDDILIGTHSGGMWRTLDGGQTKAPVNDKAPFLPLSSIERNPQNPRTIYYATGIKDAGILTQLPGMGMFKSTNNGTSFFPLSATQNSDFEETYDIAVSPIDSNIIFVSTRDPLSKAELQQSTDGGQSFTKVYTSPTNNIITQIVLPEDGSIIIGTYTGLLRSPSVTNPTFTPLGPAQGLIGAVAGNRIEIRICRDFPDILYMAAGTFNNIKEVYRSEDHGQNWTKLTDPSSAAFLNTGGYNRLLLEVKPDDPDYVLIGGIEAAYSTDGGQSWTRLPNTHIDYHTAVFDGDYFWMGNDGGLWKYKVDSPEVFVNLNENLVNTEFYGADIFPTGDSYIGGNQDNGTYRYLAPGDGQPISSDTITRGDGGFARISRQDPNVAYYESLGRFWRTDSALSPGAVGDPSTGFTQIGEELPGLTSFPRNTSIASPYTIGYHNHDHVYICQRQTNDGRVIRSVDGGQTFTSLTINHTQWLTAIACSREQSPTLYYGSQQGRIWRVDNADVATEGQEVDISPMGGSFGTVECITPHPSDSSVIFVVFHLPTGSAPFGVDYVWRVSDVKSANPVWTSIQGDLPLNIPMRWIDSSPVDPDNHLFLSTDFGLYTSIDGGMTWQREASIPNVSVVQTRLRESDNRLFVFTHGRGAWTAYVRNWPTSIERLEQVLPFTVYPNPASEEIFLKDIEQPCTYRIIDMAGKQVQAGQYQPGAAVNIQALAKGSYSLLVETKEQRGARVFVKK